MIFRNNDPAHRSDGSILLKNAKSDRDHRLYVKAKDLALALYGPSSALPGVEPDEEIQLVKYLPEGLVDTMSWWRENGDLYVLLRKDMINAPVQVTRKDHNIYITGYIEVNHECSAADLHQSKLRAHAAIQGIESKWSNGGRPFCLEGQNNYVSVETDIKVKGVDDFKPEQKYFTMSMRKGGGSSSSAWLLFVDGFGWRINNNDVEMKLYWVDSQSMDFTGDEAAHEFGHRLGLGDADLTEGSKLFGETGSILFKNRFYRNQGRDQAAPTRGQVNGYDYIIPGDEFVIGTISGSGTGRMENIGGGYEIMRSIRDNGANYVVSDFSVALVWEAFKTGEFQIYPTG